MSLYVDIIKYAVLLILAVVAGYKVFEFTKNIKKKLLKSKQNTDTLDFEDLDSDF